MAPAHTVFRLFAAGLLLMASFVTAAAQPATSNTAQYIVGPEDVLAITVFDQPMLTGRFPVEADGGFTFPLIGSIRAGGQTLDGIRDRLRAALQNGFVKDPQITITVAEYRSQRIFVMGEVREPGMVTMTGPMTVMEALARARGTTPAAAKDLLIVHAADAPSSATTAPLTPQQVATANATRVDLGALQNGDLSKNVPLRDGDTLFVPKADVIFVFGQVRSPGQLAIDRGTTVLQVLAMAGGVTERSAPGRIRIVRIVDGKRKEIKAKMEDVLQDGDTLVVPQRYF